jgi:hypothetical protein
MVVSPLGLSYSQEIFRQNILLYGEVEAIGERGTILEAAVCFLLLAIRDNDKNTFGENINVSGSSNKTALEYTSIKLELSLKNKS